ncbi:sugar transferase [Candidatus Omnitrophota bacterium]
MAKRFYEITVSLLGLLVLSPLFCIIALLIKIEDGGTIFFKGKRVGRSFKEFNMFKFRTMIHDATKNGIVATAEDDSRITRVGRFLRKCKLDEFPQLINVIKGDMSIVGPRPRMPWDLNFLTNKDKPLFTVKPGITDLSSLRFINQAEILKGSKDPNKDYLMLIVPEKNKLGLKYINNQSFMLDIKITVITVLKVMLLTFRAVVDSTEFLYNKRFDSYFGKLSDYPEIHQAEQLVKPALQGEKVFELKVLSQEIPELEKSYFIIENPHGKTRIIKDSLA